MNYNMNSYAYVPTHYQLPSESSHYEETVKDFIETYSFAQLISVSDDGEPLISRIPMVLRKKQNLDSDLDLKRDYILVGHMAYANMHWKHLEKSKKPVTLIFSGPHSYISPSWYEKDDVPTWNYSEVRIYGQINILDRTSSQVMEHLKTNNQANPDQLLQYKIDILNDLVAQNESQFEEPWTMDHLITHEPQYFYSKLQKIQFFEITIDKIDVKFKMSQNRSVTDQESVVTNLRQHAQKLATGPSKTYAIHGMIDVATLMKSLQRPTTHQTDQSNK